MVEAYQTTRYRTFDGRDFATEAEADAHEEAHFADALVGLTSAQVRAALMRDQNDKPAISVADAIERAAYQICKKRKADGELRRAPNGGFKTEAPPQTTTAPAYV